MKPWHNSQLNDIKTISTSEISVGLSTIHIQLANIQKSSCKCTHELVLVHHVQPRDALPKIPADLLPIEPKEPHAGDEDEEEGGEDGGEWMSRDHVTNAEEKVRQKRQDLFRDGLG